MNKLTMLLAAGALVVGAQQGKALTFSDADDFTAGNTVPGVLIGAGVSYPNSFNIIAPDGTSSFTVAGIYGIPTAGQTFNSNPTFNTLTDTITSGTGSMGFWFQVGPNARYDVQIEDIVLGGNGNTTSITQNVLLQNGLSVQIEAQLQANGFVNYTVSNTSGAGIGPEVILDYAYLQIDATRRQTGVPDGGATAVMLGLGCLGIAGLRRKLS